MAKKHFNGRIALDVRNAKADWSAYAPPEAKDGAPNILYIVWDDVGFGAFECYGGLIETPNMSRLAAMGLRYTQFHTTALCSPTRSALLTGRNATSNGMACISEFATGYPGSNARIPFENAMIPAVLVEHGYSTYALGKWHLTPDFDNHAAGSRRQDDEPARPGQAVDRRQGGRVRAHQDPARLLRPRGGRHRRPRRGPARLQSVCCVVGVRT